MAKLEISLENIYSLVFVIEREIHIVEMRKQLYRLGKGPN